MHGSFDLISCKRFAFGKVHSEIQKVSNPEVYFDGKPEELSKAFIVYPLEAIGYDQAIRSPYLDMLFQLKNRLRNENQVFVIGFSFRDSIIASIFDEVVREKLEQGKGQDMKVLLIGSNPEMVVKNLKHKGYENVANAITQVQVNFPNTLDQNIAPQGIISDMEKVLDSIAKKMDDAAIIFDRASVSVRLKRYGIDFREPRTQKS